MNLARGTFALFPAYAGVIRGVADLKAAGLTFPRICGGDPAKTGHYDIYANFSPHMRG